MTRLVEVMQDMGLDGETSRTGRWIRLHREQDSVYVVEAAWGGGYYIFSDASAEQPEIHCDPATAIEAGLHHLVGASLSAREAHSHDRAASR